jgi:uracil-DNA glycosylase
LSRVRSIAALQRQNARCRRCLTAGFPIVPPPVFAGHAGQRAYLYGLAPGRFEAGTGRPWQGRAGRTIRRWLQLDEDEFFERFYCASVTRCFPGPSPSGRGDRVPSPREQEACAVWLEQELRLIHPRLLIPVGRLAIERFLPKRPLDQLIGRAFEIEHAGGISIAVPLPHPSGASSWIHQGDHPKLLERALLRIGRELRELGIVVPQQSSSRATAS